MSTFDGLRGTMRVPVCARCPLGEMGEGYCLGEMGAEVRSGRPSVGLEAAPPLMGCGIFITTEF